MQPSIQQPPQPIKCYLSFVLFGRCPVTNLFDYMSRSLKLYQADFFKGTEFIYLLYMVGTVFTSDKKSQADPGNADSGREVNRTSRPRRNRRANEKEVSRLRVWYSKNFLGHVYSRSLNQGPEPFLRSRQLCNYSRTFQHIMEPERSALCSQEPSTGPYPELDRASTYHLIYLS
jgi:hypothetical protein